MDLKYGEYTHAHLKAFKMKENNQTIPGIIHNGRHIATAINHQTSRLKIQTWPTQGQPFTIL